MMNSEFHNDKTGFYVRGLLAVTVLLGALILLQVAGFVTSSSQARVMAARLDPNGQKVESAGEIPASAQTCADELKKKNLFVMTPPKEHPVSEVLGILGEEALIGDDWYRVGDSVGDAKIIAIEPTKVKIVWNGQEKEFSPIVSGGEGGGSERPGSGRPSSSPRSVSGRPAGGMPSRGGPSGPSGTGPSAEERERMRQRFQNMSREERQRAREEMRQRIEARPQ